MTVLSVEPATGVLSGGTRVVLRGRGFDRSMQLMVRIGARALRHLPWRP